MSDATDESLATEVAVLRNDVTELRKDVKDLLAAWKTATGVIAFIKGLSLFGAAVGTAWLAFKTIFH